MSDVGTPDAPPPLTPGERARLRPTVDVTALERFLAAAPSRARPLALVLCAAAPGPMVIRGALQALGLPAETIDRLAPPLVAPPVTPFGAPQSQARATGAKRLAFIPTQHTDLLFRFDDPALVQLWGAVESQGGGDA